MQRDCLLLVVHRLELRRRRGDSVDMMMRHKLGCRPEEKQQIREGVEAVEGVDKPEGDQKVEKVLHDELKRREVEDDQDEYARGDSVKHKGNGVLESETKATIAISD